MKKFSVVAVLVLTFGALAFAYSGKSGTWTGYISDAKCGAHVDAACAKKCIDAGQKAVFVNDEDKMVYPIANQDKVKSHAGEHVTVQGTMAKDTLTVSSISMAKK